MGSLGLTWYLQPFRISQLLKSASNKATAEVFFLKLRAFPSYQDIEGQLGSFCSLPAFGCFPFSLPKNFTLVTIVCFK